jgi:streptogramin lyase
MGLTLDQAGIYWTQPSTVAAPGNAAIGRANIFNGAVTNQRHVGGAGVPIGDLPCGVTTDADKFFWALSGAPGKVMRAHGIFPPFTEVAPAAFPAGTTSDPCGVAEANFLVYFANRGNATIGSVNLTGTTLGPTIPTGAGSTPCGVAVAGDHIYWTDRDADQVGRANLDGSGVNDGPEFPLDVGDKPCGIAVDPTAVAEPAIQTFADTGVGGRSDIATLVVRNTSSSTLDPGAVGIVGPDADQFAITGNGCTVNVVAINGTCIVNVDFAPTSEGDKSATLTVASNASDSPTEFALIGRGTPTPAEPPVEPPTEPPPVEPAEFARTLSISYSRKGERFKGELASAKAACAAGQKVVVVRRRRGDDVRIGSDSTDAAGRWRVAEPGAQGRFHAETKPSVLPAAGTCLAAESETLRVR